MEILLLLILGCGGFMVVAVLALVALRSSRGGAVHPAPPFVPARAATASAPPLADDADARQTIVARLTQRFCPQCRSPLAADSPEGLCPACLMMGGLASGAFPAAEINGMAITTPPSGSQPPASGEWANLAEQFPHLEILELLGRGGMGAVYKARQKNLDRMVALKVVPPEAAKDPAFTERFNREARALARLNHPSIVTVYDFGQSGDVYFLLMEYVDGVNLRQALQASRLEPREALAIVPQICDALQYAHDQGVVHRDIKPENVLLDRAGRVKIADFGLAKLLGQGPDNYTLTRTQQVMGTPRYMAPEQIEKPTTVDHRADIYSLGVVIYEMLTGELPLGRFEPPSHKVQLDVRIDEVVLRTLEKEPDRRYQRASQLKTELASAASWPIAPAAATVAARSPAPPQPSWRTPAPAAKSGLPGSGDYPGGVPLGQVLMVALGMVAGVLMMGGGLFAIVWGLIYSIKGAADVGTIGGWWGAGFGCLVGGFGSAAGSYNSYRQMAGSVDLLRSPQTTWLDWVLRSYLAVGLALLAAGLILSDSVAPEATRTLLLLGGISTFQAAVFLAWRKVVKPRGAAESVTPARAEPGLFRAAFLPAAAVLVVLAIAWIDVVYAKDIYAPVRGGNPPAMRTIELWLHGVLLAAAVLVPLSLIGLAAWQVWGPRTPRADGKSHVAYPFAARGWLWGVATLAAAALVAPWFRLQLVPGAEVVVPISETYELGPGATRGVTVARDPELREIAAIPAGYRFVHRGGEIGKAAVASILVAFAAVLVSLVARPGELWRTFILGGCSVVGLLSIVGLLHESLDSPQWLVVDARTESGLSTFIAKFGSARTPSTGPVLQALRPAYGALPAIGMILALAACGAGLFLAVTELCWGVAAPSVAPVPAPAAKSPPLDPAREAIRSRVAGPAIGLMIAGAIGLLPLLLALIVVPASIVLEPQVAPSRGYDQNSPPPPVHHDTDEAKTSFHEDNDARAAALAAAVLPGAHPAVGPAIALPFILAQQSPPMADSIPRYFLLVPLLALFYLLDLAISITLIVAGWRMRQLKSHGLSLVAAFLAMLPCTFGWIIGLPMGIWAFTILQRPEVREAFEG